jgi:hypothetical protein
MMDDDVMLTVELKNTSPVDLLDLTVSFAALGQSFRDYATEQTADPLPDNLKLYVRELRSGSIIADLIPLLEQAQWIDKHIDVLAGFAANFHDILNYFLGRPTALERAPSRKEAQQISQVLEPVAKDFGSQMNLQVTSGRDTHLHTHYHVHVASLDANAAQNRTKSFLGPQLPSSQVLTDQLMVLDQVRNSTKAKTGDRGVIEAVSQRAVKLQFASDEVKRAIIDIDGNPLQSVFQVDVEVRAVQGEPKIYRIIEVKDVIRD